MSFPNIPRTPAKKGATNAAPANPPGLPFAPPDAAITPQLEAMTKHDAKLVNLDTHTHVDSKGNEHKSHAGNKAKVGPLTIVFANKMGHPPMRFGEHAKQKTNVHKHITKGHPHPNVIAAQIAERMNLPAPSRKG